MSDPTARAVRDAIAISREISYFSVVWQGELRVLMVRPFGRLGQGMWMRSVTGDAPRVTQPW